MDSLKLWWASPRSWWTKSVKEGKNRGTLVFYSNRTHSNLIYAPVSIRDVDWKKSHVWTFPQVPSQHRGITWDTSRIRKELLRRHSQTTSTSTGATEIGAWTNQCLSRKCMENVWRNSYHWSTSCWNQIPTGSGFPDKLHLEKGTRIHDPKPRSSPSHFWAFRQKHSRGNFEGETSSHTSFNQLNGQSMLPVTPMASVTTPATIDRDSQVGAPDPITGATSPTSDRGSAPSPVTTPRRSTWSTKGVPPVATPHPESDRWRVSDISCVQVVQWC